MECRKKISSDIIIDIRRSLLQRFGWLADLYMIDFFVDNHWDRLPSSWKAVLENLEPSDWYDVLSDIRQQSNTLKHVLPLSFICLRILIEAVSLRRRAVNGLKEFAEACHIKDENLPNCFPCSENCNQLRVKVKLKKQHEIDRICYAIELLQGTIVDVGAGVGHLSRQIAVRFAHSAYPLRVITIEADQKLVQKAAQLDSMLRRTLSRHRSNNAKCDGETDVELPERRALFLEPGQKLDGCGNVNVNTTRCVIGLHTCGDLSSFIVREFIVDRTAKALLHFGCCYHKLGGGKDKPFMQNWIDDISSEDERACDSKGGGFPMSAAYANFSLSYAARELSCHAIELFRAKLREKCNANEYRIHCFRAILEWLIVKMSRRNDKAFQKFEMNFRHQGFRSVKAEYLTSFAAYIKAALANKAQLYDEIMIMLEKQPSLTDEIDEMLCRWRRTLAVYCIRLIIAKLIETVILDDRRCFVEEQGYDAYLVPLFDPQISARNIALVCLK
ncbi:unnamed protein product [Toxocara canis]|uniref:Protein RRNAD1 n=1 Tax=Toxocara canis TaxID=6265 RepID=A0A183UP31_TOXCA|nr:unnamed protein product [Toxocara canis]